MYDLLFSQEVFCLQLTLQFLADVAVAAFLLTNQFLWKICSVDGVLVLKFKTSNNCFLPDGQGIDYTQGLNHCWK